MSTEQPTVGNMIYYLTRSITTPRPALVVFDHGDGVFNLQVWLPNGRSFTALKVRAYKTKSIEHFWFVSIDNPSPQPQPTEVENGESGG